MTRFIEIEAYTDLSASSPQSALHQVNSAAIAHVHYRTDWRWGPNAQHYGKPVAIVRLLVTSGTFDTARDVNRVGPTVLYVVGKDAIANLRQALRGAA